MNETVIQAVGPAGGTVVTPSGAAGVQIPAGTFSQQVMVTITRLPTPSSPGAGPLPTSLNQYGPYYDFTTSPQVAQFGDSARVGVCQVTDPSSAFYPPEPHDRLRLAHTVGSSIEILERVGINDFLRCTNVTASVFPLGGWRTALSALARRVIGRVTPASLYAAHGGLGGKVKSFSPFGAVVTALPNPCDPIPFRIGDAVTRSLDDKTCRYRASVQSEVAFGLPLFDLFEYSLQSTTLFKLAFTTTAFDGRLGPLFTPTLHTGSALYGGRDINVYVLAPAGRFRMQAGSLDSTATGAYTLTSTISSGATECLPVSAADVVTADLILATTCAAQTFYFLQPTLSGRVTVTSSSFLPVIEIHRANDGSFINGSLEIGQTATVDWSKTPPPQPAISVVVRARQAGTGGRYTISFAALP